MPATPGMPAREQERSWARRAGSGRQAIANARRLVFVAVALTFTACGPRRASVVVPDPWPAVIAAADDEVAAGCYRCLERALTGYERAIAAGSDAAVATRAYRTAVRLAIRDRLLGLYPAPHREAPTRLRSLGAPADVADAEAVLPVVAWRRGTLGVNVGMNVSRADLPTLRLQRAALEARADADSWIAELLLALVGSQPWVALEEGQRIAGRVTPGLDPDIWWRRHPDDVSLSFMRLALLRETAIEDWRLLQSRHPQFEESDAFIGDQELLRGRLVSAEEALARSLEAFPDMLASVALRADIRQQMEDYGLALDLYDGALARHPEHREALLGRMRVLGFLQRHEDAVDVADRMLALGQWYVGEARYWQAWNLFQLRRVDEARASLDEARRLLVNADVHYLGGVIAFRQQRPEDALRDFDAAVALEERHCEAHFDRAAVRLIRQEWLSAARGFDEAYACHTARTRQLEQRVADAREARLPEETKATLVRRREQALRDHHHQRGWARYNAAVAHANVGALETARQRIDDALALGGPAAEAARDLVAQLRGR